MDEKISTIRKSYLSGELDEANLDGDPIAMFAAWMNAAIAAGIEEPNGMALATASADGAPSVRIVLLRGFDERGFAFYTNYDSAKGQDLLANPRAAITFWWPRLERQVRISGRVERIARPESEAYFHSRPRGHQLAAWASPQSRPVAGRAELQARAADAERLFPGDVPLPDFWGGYRLGPERMEFWQGRENRLHDRFVFERRQGEWTVARLAP
ncbi:MAG: pyridoxamine 5'-phosphate oxidase [Bryobacteraceae bacterium]